MTFLVLCSGCRGWGWWLICDIRSHRASGGGGEVSPDGGVPRYLSLVQVLPLTRGWITNRVRSWRRREKVMPPIKKKRPGRESSLLKMSLTTSELNLSFFFLNHFFFSLLQLWGQILKCLFHFPSSCYYLFFFQSNSEQQTAFWVGNQTESQLLFYVNAFLKCERSDCGK